MSLARVAPVRLGGLVFLSCNMMVSKKQSDRDPIKTKIGTHTASLMLLRAMIISGCRACAGLRPQRHF